MPDELAAPDSRRLRLELAVFLLVVWPPMLLAALANASDQTFVVAATATIVHDVGLCALVVFFLWRNDERVTSIGWTARRFGRELVLGIVLYLPMVVVLVLVEWLSQAAGLGSPRGPPAFLVPRSTGELVLAVVLVLVVAWAEETVFRGYLILRLRALTRSTSVAVLLSCFIFASGHLYGGPAGVLGVAVLALAFALVYLWRKSLVAPIVMHFLQDFLGLVVVPWLGLHH